MHTLVTIQYDQPAEPRTFRTFRSVGPAVRLMQRLDDRARCRIVQYGKDARDVRAVVNYFGSNPRQSRKVDPTVRYLLRDGVVVNRLLPVARRESTREEMSS